MWCVRWAGCVALVAAAAAAGLVLGEPRLSFHPPVYLYEFGDLSEQTVHFATVGHIRPGQRFTKVELKPFPCVRRERFVRVVVLNAHNPAHVSVRQHAAYIHYTRGERTQSTYIVWASSAGPQDPGCLLRLTRQDMLSDHRRRLGQYQMKNPMKLHSRQGYSLKHGYYPGHMISSHNGRRQQWSDQDDDNHVEGRQAVASAKENTHETETGDSLFADSSESSKDVVGDETNNDVFNKQHGVEKNEATFEPIWKLKRQRNNNLNRTEESLYNVEIDMQDIEDPFNITETVKFGLNTNIFRRTSPLRTVNEEIIEEYITPEQFLAQSTNLSDMSVMPGFTYQFFNLPSSSEGTAMNLPPPEHLPKDQSEWDAYFKNLIDNNSSMIVTEMPMLADVIAPNVAE